MKTHSTLLMSFLIFVIALSSCQNTFDQKIWLKHDSNDLTDVENPRIQMVDDIIKNHLKVGMLKEDVIRKLGRPTSDTIGTYLPKNKQLPDSLNVENIFEKSKIEQERQMNLLNEWYKTNYRSAPMLIYYVGWSLMDPVFLEIRMNEENKIVDFWRRQS